MGRNHSALTQNQNTDTDRAKVREDQSESYFAATIVESPGNQLGEIGANIPAGKKDDNHIHVCDTDAGHNRDSFSRRNAPGSNSGPGGSFCRRKNGSEGLSGASAPAKSDRHGGSVCADVDVEISAERCVCVC
jgi:hypothetical protein